MKLEGQGEEDGMYEQKHDGRRRQEQPVVYHTDSEASTDQYFEYQQKAVDEAHTVLEQSGTGVYPCELGSFTRYYYHRFAEALRWCMREQRMSLPEARYETRTRIRTHSNDPVKAVARFAALMLIASVSEGWLLQRGRTSDHSIGGDPLWGKVMLMARKMLRAKTDSTTQCYDIPELFRFYFNDLSISAHNRAIKEGVTWEQARDRELCVRKQEIPDDAMKKAAYRAAMSLVSRLLPPTDHEEVHQLNAVEVLTRAKAGMKSGASRSANTATPGGAQSSAATARNRDLAVSRDPACSS